MNRPQQIRDRSFARLVSGAQLPEVCDTVSGADPEEPLNIADDGKTFCCAITGVLLAGSDFILSPVIIGASIHHSIRTHICTYKQ